MCGIFGFVEAGPRAQAASQADLEEGMSRIRHRGPDGEGTWVSDNGQVGLSHVRLSIIDLSESAAQPMASDDGRYVMTYNGEVYNYIELRAELGAHRFRTTSDSEVILRAFETWGAECVRRLRGMFAFAIWDKHEQRMFIARDRFGIKPFYWAHSDGGFHFGSEVKALLPFLAERSVNASALADYFTFQFCLGNKTLTQDVQQLPPAHYGWVSPGEEPQIERYWEVQYEIDRSHDEAWFEERLRELLHDSVDVHMRADVEVGAYVSGGVDSSLLATMGRATRPQDPFKIFNGRFTDNNFIYDESRYAHDLAEANDMDLYVRDITEDDFVDALPQVIWHLDQPTAGPGSFPQYMVSQEVGKHIKVVLGGQGGDEIFGGYARYMVGYLEQCLKGALGGELNNGTYDVPFESMLGNLTVLEQYKPLIREVWSKGLFGERDDRYWRIVNRANTFSEIIVPDCLEQESTREEFKLIFWGDNLGPNDYLNSMTHFDFKTLLPALLQVEDRMSMAHGVESRVPFLDHPLIEFAATIPANIKFKDGSLKRMLKEVFAPQLPNSINERKDKMGFPVPLNDWLRQGGRARDMVGDIMGSSKAQTRSYLGDGFTLDKVLDGQSAYGRNLWALLGLELWHQQFIDS